jgi:hypothetical protein
LLGEPNPVPPPLLLESVPLVPLLCDHLLLFELLELLELMVLRLRLRLLQLQLVGEVKLLVYLRVQQAAAPPSRLLRLLLRSHLRVRSLHLRQINLLRLR